MDGCEVEGVGAGLSIVISFNSFQVKYYFICVSRCMCMPAIMYGEGVQDRWIRHGDFHESIDFMVLKCAIYHFTREEWMGFGIESRGLHNPAINSDEGV